MAHLAVAVWSGCSVKLLFQFFDNLLPVFSLPFRLTGVVADDVAAAKLAIADRDLLGMEVFRDDLEAPGPCEDLLFDLRDTAHAGSQEILPAGPGELIPVLL